MPRRCRVGGGRLGGRRSARRGARPRHRDARSGAAGSTAAGALAQVPARADAVLRPHPQRHARRGLCHLPPAGARQLRRGRALRGRGCGGAGGGAPPPGRAAHTPAQLDGPLEPRPSQRAQHVLGRAGERDRGAGLALHDADGGLPAGRDRERARSPGAVSPRRRRRDAGPARRPLGAGPPRRPRRQAQRDRLGRGRPRRGRAAALRRGARGADAPPPRPGRHAARRLADRLPPDDRCGLPRDPARRHRHGRPRQRHRSIPGAGLRHPHDAVGPLPRGRAGCHRRRGEAGRAALLRQGPLRRLPRRPAPQRLPVPRACRAADRPRHRRERRRPRPLRGDPHPPAPLPVPHAALAQRHPHRALLPQRGRRQPGRGGRPPSRAARPVFGGVCGRGPAAGACLAHPQARYRPERRRAGVPAGLPRGPGGRPGRGPRPDRARAGAERPARAGRSIAAR